MASKSRGLFIVVEGLDRAGKTTQVARLVERLESELGMLVEGLKFPDRTTPIGQNLNSYLTTRDIGSSLPLQAAHLLFSANRWEAAGSLTNKLQAGTTLVVDRYAYSGAVYTAARSSLPASPSSRPGNPAWSAGVGLEWTWAPDVGLPAPDMLLFLDIDEAVAAERGGFGEERYESTDMQRAVRKTFYELIDRVDTPTTKVDAGKSMAEVEEDIWNSIKALAEASSSKELGMKTLGPLRP